MIALITEGIDMKILKSTSQVYFDRMYTCQNKEKKFLQ